MSITARIQSLAFGTSLSLIAAIGAAHSQETIKLGLSVPLSGSGAIWGKGSEFMCNKAAQEIAKAGGVKAGGETYNFQCLAYDNKYNAAEGTRVAQTLLNREGVKFIGGSLGTGPRRPCSRSPSARAFCTSPLPGGLASRGRSFR